jgi:hypothetical protein
MARIQGVANLDAGFRFDSAFILTSLRKAFGHSCFSSMVEVGWAMTADAISICCEKKLQLHSPSTSRALCHVSVVLASVLAARGQDVGTRSATLAAFAPVCTSRREGLAAPRIVLARAISF